MCSLGNRKILVKLVARISLKLVACVSRRFKANKITNKCDVK